MSDLIKRLIGWFKPEPRIFDLDQAAGILRRLSENELACSALAAALDIEPATEAADFVKQTATACSHGLMREVYDRFKERHNVGLD